MLSEQPCSRKKTVYGQCRELSPEASWALVPVLPVVCGLRNVNTKVQVEGEVCWWRLGRRRGEKPREGGPWALCWEEEEYPEMD